MDRCLLAAWIDPLRSWKHRLLSLFRHKLERTIAYVESRLPHGSVLLELLDRNAELVILDIGACEALDSIRYSRLFPNAQVHAFEPVKSNVALAKKNLRRFRATRVRVHHTAVGEKIGKLTLHRSSGKPDGVQTTSDWDFGNKSSSLMEPNLQEIQGTWSWLNFAATELVPCTTLDQFVREFSIRQIDLIHMDVQGAEHLVLRGGLPALATVQAIWLEVSSQEFYKGQLLAPQMAQLLEDAGLHRHFSLGEPPQWDELWVRQHTKPK